MLLQQEKAHTKWKLIQHDEIDRRIQPLRNAVEDVKNGVRELTPEYEMDHIFSTKELEAWIDSLQEAQAEFEKDMGIKYGVLGCRIYAVQAKVDLLLELDKTSSRGTVTQLPYIQSIEECPSYRWGLYEESMVGPIDIHENKEDAVKDDDEIPPPPDSPPGKSVIVNFPVVNTPESASGNTPLAHRPR